MFVITIWMVSTIVFYLPRISGQNPLAEKIRQEAQYRGSQDPNVADRIRILRPNMFSITFCCSNTSSSSATLCGLIWGVQ